MFLYILSSKNCWVIELIHKGKGHEGIDRYVVKQHL